MKFDAYSLRARVLPGVLVVLPLILLASLSAISPIVGLVPAIGGLAVAYWAAELVRERGLASETRLKAKWGGFPTTELLRYGSRPADARRTGRRDALETVTGHSLPSRQAEDSDADAASTDIEHVVRIGIARVRETKVEAAELQQENTAYGFRRNLRALKPFGLVTCLVSIGVALVTAQTEATLMGTIVAIDIVVLLLWLAVVRDAWVQRQAEKYAERFFIAIETIARTASADNGART